MNADDITFEELGIPRATDEEDSKEEMVADLSNAVFTGTYTYSVGQIPVPTPPVPVTRDLFDLADLGIAVVGTFDSQGNPIGWSFNSISITKLGMPILDCSSGGDYFVYVRGLFSRKLTNDRRAAVGLLPL